MGEAETSKCTKLHHPHMKKSFIEFALYALFLSTTCIVAFGSVGSSLYFCTEMISKMFVDKKFRSNLETELNFKQISSVDELHQFTESVLLEGFYGIDIDHVANKFTRFMTENILMGSVRIRQLRVKNDACDVHPHFTHLFKDCFDYFSKSSEDTNSFGIKVGSAWTYHSQEELEGFLTWGKFQSYPGGGFFQELDGTLEKAKLNIHNLFDNGWINRGTRVVFIEFTILNPNSNVFCSTKLIVEVLPTGGFITSTHFYVLKTWKLGDFEDYVLMGFGYAFIAQILAYTWKMTRKMVKQRQRFFFDLWNMLDFFIVLISYFAIGFSIFREIHIDKKIQAFRDDPKKHVSFDVVDFWLVMFLDSTGICVGLVWIRMLKYVKFSSTMLQFEKTLERCAKDIAGFSLMFFIVFVAYAQLGFILFGSEIKDFHTTFEAIFTLMRTLLGDFDYLAIEKANRVLGPIYFLSYIFFMFFILLNIFVAIINDTYERVKSEGSQEILPLGEYIKEKLRFWIKRAKAKVEARKSSNVKQPAGDVSEGVLISTSAFLYTAGDKTNECASCQVDSENLDRMNERIFALQIATDHCVMKFTEVVNKLRQ